MLDRIFDQANFIKRGLDQVWVNNEVISNNIANADTPGFIAKEVVVTATPGKHFHETEFDYELREKEGEINANGNNVNLGEEMAELAKNSIEYNALVQKITLEFNKIEYVLNEGR